MANRWANWKQWETLFWGAPTSLQMVTVVIKLKDTCFLKENYDQPRQHIKKHRHSFANKGLSSQSYGFSSSHVCVWGTIKKAEQRRIDASEVLCWRRLANSWTARRSNQSILKEISPEYSLEGLMLKLKLQNFGHLMWRTDPLEKTLMLGKTEDRRRGQQMMRQLDSIIDLVDMSLSKFWELMTDREARHAAVHGVKKSWTQLSELNWYVWLSPFVVHLKLSQHCQSAILQYKIKNFFFK